MRLRVSPLSSFAVLLYSERFSEGQLPRRRLSGRFLRKRVLSRWPFSVERGFGVG